MGCVAVRGTFWRGSSSNLTKDAKFHHKRVTKGNMDGVSKHKTDWKVRLTQLLGSDATCVFREFVYNMPSIHEHDQNAVENYSAASEEDMERLVCNTVMQLAKLCNEEQTFGRAFIKAWNEYEQTVENNYMNSTLPGLRMGYVQSLFIAACENSGMLKLNRKSHTPGAPDQSILIPSKSFISSATFRLMQFSSQDILLHGEKYLSDILNLPWITIHRKSDWKVSVSLIDFNASTLQEVDRHKHREASTDPSSQSASEGRGRKKFIKIRHGKKYVLLVSQSERNTSQLQLKWEITIYIDQKALQEIHKPFQLDRQSPEVSSAAKTIHLPLVVSTDPGSGYFDDIHAKSRSNDAQEQEGDAFYGIPEPCESKEENISRFGLSTKELNEICGKDLVFFDAKITKASITKSVLSFKNFSSASKKRENDLRLRLKNIYDVDLSVVKHL